MQSMFTLHRLGSLLPISVQYRNPSPEFIPVSESGNASKPLLLQDIRFISLQSHTVLLQNNCRGPTFLFLLLGAGEGGGGMLFQWVKTASRNTLLPWCLLQDGQAQTSSSCGWGLDDLQSSSSCATCHEKYLEESKEILRAVTETKIQHQ